MAQYWFVLSCARRDVVRVWGIENRFMTVEGEEGAREFSSVDSRVLSYRVVCLRIGGFRLLLQQRWLHRRDRRNIPEPVEPTPNALLYPGLQHANPLVIKCANTSPYKSAELLLAHTTQPFPRSLAHMVRSSNPHSIALILVLVWARTCVASPR